MGYLLFSHKKEGSADTCYSMDEPQKHNAQWKTPNTRDNMLYDSISMKCPVQANPQTEVDLRLSGATGRGQ